MDCNSESCAKWEEYKQRPLAEALIPQIIFVLAAVTGILAAGYRYKDSGVSLITLGVMIISLISSFTFVFCSRQSRYRLRISVFTGLVAAVCGLGGAWRAADLYGSASGSPFVANSFRVVLSQHAGQSRKILGYFEQDFHCPAQLQLPTDVNVFEGDTIRIDRTFLKQGRVVDYHRRRGIAAVYYYDRAPEIICRNPTMRGRVRAMLYSRWRKLSDAQVSGMLLALYSGNSSYIKPLVAAHYRRAGLAHVLAASGMHVGIMAGLPLLLCALIRAPKSVRALAPLPFVLGYLYFSDAPPSLMRAVLMCVICAGQYLVLRRVRPFRALYSAMLVLLLLQPWQLYSAAFQLSSVATAGILLGCLGLRQYMPRRPKYFNANLAVGVPAQMAVLPVLWARFGVVQLNGLLCGPLVTPLVALVMLCGPLVLLPGRVGQFFAAAAGFLCRLSDRVAIAGMRVPGTFLREDALQLVLLLAVLSLLAGAALHVNDRRQRLRHWTLPLTLTVIFAFGAYKDCRRLLPEEVTVVIEGPEQVVINGQKTISLTGAAFVLGAGRSRKVHFELGDNSDSTLRAVRKMVAEGLVSDLVFADGVPFSFEGELLLRDLENAGITCDYGI